MDQKKRILKKVVLLVIWMAAGVVVLSLESLLTRQDIFQRFALGLGAFGLVMMTCIIALAVFFKD